MATKAKTKKIAKAAAWVRPEYGEQRATENGSTVVRLKADDFRGNDRDGTTVFAVLTGGHKDSVNLQEIKPGGVYWTDDSGKLLLPADDADLLQMVGEPTRAELEAEVAGMRVL